MSALIRSVGGLETPAPGRWTIAQGQPVVGRAGRWPGRSRRSARTVSGSLLITDAGGIAFQLRIAGEPNTEPLVYQSISIDSLRRDGTWSVAGQLITAGQVTPARSLLIYHGVFRSGPGAIAWLGWQLNVPLLDLSGRGAERSVIRHLELSAELNAEAPAELTTRGNPASQPRKAHQS